MYVKALINEISYNYVLFQLWFELCDEVENLHVVTNELSWHVQNCESDHSIDCNRQQIIQDLNTYIFCEMVSCKDGLQCECMYCFVYQLNKTTVAFCRSHNIISLGFERVSLKLSSQYFSQRIRLAMPMEEFVLYDIIIRKTLDTYEIFQGLVILILFSFCHYRHNDSFPIYLMDYQYASTCPMVIYEL